jgi:hypothetical protein
MEFWRARQGRLIITETDHALRDSGVRAAGILDCEPDFNVFLLRSWMNISHREYGGMCRDKFFARKIDAFSGQSRLPAGNFRQDAREHSYEYRSNSGYGTIVGLQEISDPPKDADQTCHESRSPWIPICRALMPFLLTSIREAAAAAH